MPAGQNRRNGDTTPRNPRQSIQVIARAAKVLRALEGEEQGLSLGQIAQRVGLARSTVQRIVDSLSAEQFLIAATPSAGVRLGPALIRLAASARLDIGQITHPLMLNLAQEVSETVDLSVLKGNAAVFLDQVQGPQRLRAVSAIGEAFPLHCTANGKALLSVIDADALERALELPMLKLTPNTRTRRADLLREVDTCRRTGLAFDNEEHSEGICAIGTGFLDPIGRPMALSIPVPAARYKRSKASLSRALLAAREQILESLGSKSG